MSLQSVPAIFAGYIAVKAADIRFRGGTRRETYWIERQLARSSRAAAPTAKRGEAAEADVEADGDDTAVMKPLVPAMIGNSRLVSTCRAAVRAECGQISGLL